MQRDSRETEQTQHSAISHAGCQTFSDPNLSPDGAMCVCVCMWVFVGVNGCHVERPAPRRTACERTGPGAGGKELGCVGLCRRRCFRISGRKSVPRPVSSLPCSFFSRTHTLLSEPRRGKAGPFETSFCKQISKCKVSLCFVLLSAEPNTQNLEVKRLPRSQGEGETQMGKKARLFCGLWGFDLVWKP